MMDRSLTGVLTSVDNALFFCILSHYFIITLQKKMITAEVLFEVQKNEMRVQNDLVIN